MESTKTPAGTRPPRELTWEEKGGTADLDRRQRQLFAQAHGLTQARRAIRTSLKQDLHAAFDMSRAARASRTLADETYQAIEDLNAQLMACEAAQRRIDKMLTHIGHSGPPTPQIEHLQRQYALIQQRQDALEDHYKALWGKLSQARSKRVQDSQYYRLLADTRRRNFAAQSEACQSKVQGAFAQPVFRARM